MMSLSRGRPLLSGLRTRVFLAALAVFALLAAPAYLVYARIAEDATLRIATLLTEKQVQYDRYRGLATLQREVSLAQSLSRSPTIIAWAQDEHNPVLKQRGLAELEHYREAFDNRSAFIVIDASGNYYYNDAQNAYADDPFQYTVRSNNPRDGWYFTTRQRREGCFLNVDSNDVLRVTNVWINCIVSHEGQVQAIIGTGLNLSAFIREVIDIRQPGIQSVFIDQAGAVQAHADASLIDFHSLTKDLAQKSTVFSLLGGPSDTARLRTMMNAAIRGGDDIHTAMMTVGGKPMLVGVGYLDGVGWYNVTMTDVDEIVDGSLFVPAAILLGILMTLLALGLTFAFKIMVLDRLARLETGVEAVRTGSKPTLKTDPGKDEIGRLSRTMHEMVNAITYAKIDLEGQIKERTEELESLVNIDALTGIYNRRGFANAFARARELALKGDFTNGLLLIDIDHFKHVNDTEGHAAGDRVAAEVARRLASSIGTYDFCGRWGGDEFIVLLRECDSGRLHDTTLAIVEMIRNQPVVLPDGRTLALTASIGATLLKPSDSLDMGTDMADAALYSAKDQGRDRVVLFDPKLGKASLSGSELTYL